MTRGAGADGTEPDGSVVAAPIGFAEFYEREWSGAVRLAALLTQSTTAAGERSSGFKMMWRNSGLRKIKSSPARLASKIISAKPRRVRQRG